jgi:hypothetical protein
LFAHGFARWAKHGTFDWVFDTAIAVVSLLAVALVVLARRSSRARRAV